MFANLIALLAPLALGACTWRSGDHAYTLVLGVGLISVHEPESLAEPHVDRAPIHARREEALGLIVRPRGAVLGFESVQSIELDPRDNAWVEALDFGQGNFQVRAARARGACPGGAARDARGREACRTDHTVQTWPAPWRRRCSRWPRWRPWAAATP